MGNAGSSGLSQCLTSAVKDVAFPDKFLFQLLDARPYNLDIPVHPLAVTYPESNDDVAAIVTCATKFGSKVQARSGGHSYGNYGK